MIAFITTAEYITYMGCSLSDLPSDINRVIARASELIWHKTLLSWTLPVLTADVPTAIKDATCAQLEYWQDVGEGVDVYAPAGPTVLGSASYSKAPPELAPRAYRFLKYGGYLCRGIPAAGSGGSLDSDLTN